MLQLLRNRGKPGSDQQNGVVETEIGRRVNHRRDVHRKLGVDRRGYFDYRENRADRHGRWGTLKGTGLNAVVGIRGKTVPWARLIRRRGAAGSPMRVAATVTRWWCSLAIRAQGTRAPRRTQYEGTGNHDMESPVPHLPSV